MVAVMPKPPVSAAAEEFGRRLRDRRREKHWTQLNLAHLAGCTVAAVSQYENGLAQPNFGTLLDLAFVLETDAGDLVRGLKPDTPPTEYLAR